MPMPNANLWCEYARDLYLSGMAHDRPGHRPNAFAMRIMGTDRLVNTLALEFGDGVETWSTAMARRALALARPGPRDADGVSFTPDGFDALHQVASVRLGLAVATGDLTTLCPSERALVAGYAGSRAASKGLVPGEAESLAGIIRQASPPPPPPNPAGSTPTPPAFSFAFAWARRSGATATCVANRSYARMVEIGADEAPVACRLRTPEGGTLDVRVDGHGFLRPVTSPGTWRPVDVAAFLDAASTGARWADNPFVPARRDLPVQALAEIAVPGRDAIPSREAAAAIVAAVGTLVVVDGVVHRRCPPPEACVTRDGPRGAPVVTWRIPGQVEATDDMGFLRLDQHRAYRLDPLDAAGRTFLNDAAHPLYATLPLPEAPALSSMASTILGCEVDVADASSGGFEVTMPDAWLRDPCRDLAAMAAWAAAIPGEFRTDATFGDMRRAIDAALADARSGDGVAFPDTEAGERDYAVHSPVGAAWGAALRERAREPIPEGDGELTSFSP